jgi:uracil-DNA glycosylase family 4
MDSADPLKHRLNLWLKSEEAMGVPSVRRVEFAENAPEIVEKAHVAASTTTRPVAPPVVVARPVLAKPRAAEFFDQGETRVASGGASLPLLETPFGGPILSRDEKVRLLNELDQNQVKGCVKCGLSKSRAQTVFGEGDPDARICFIGEGPGKDEDASGRPFVGRAGQKLNDMIGAMGLKREQVFICNIVKCRAFMTDIGKDRPPSEEETAACTPYLLRQMEIIRPKVIVTLGLPSTRYLLKSKASMTSMRGKWHEWRGIKVMPTWHPAYVLRNYTEQTRREVWEDLKKVLVDLGMQIPKRSGKQE